MANSPKVGNLGNKKNVLETFKNPHPSRDYTIRIRIPEFTCLCPKTGQPDFATLRLEYIPDDLCVELKSLKGYISGYRNIGTYHEAVTNKILSDLEDALHPRFIRLTAKFNVRGGIHTTVIAEEIGVNSNTSGLAGTI